MKKEIENRTPEEQDRPEAYLAILRAKRDPVYRLELNCRLDSTEGWMSLSELKNKNQADRIGE
ncbi:MAG: hypothetical protein QNK37_33065 [Acidobacteriota bacterium]|nr:hypothetical protein [Acidobacteriota bacterium]